MTKQYTISVFSEDVVGLLNRVTIILTRRKINIENIITSETEVKGIYRYTIVVTVTETQVKKLVKLIEKQVEVMKAFYFTDVDLVSRELALYKISDMAITDNEEFIKVMNEYNAKIVSIAHDHVVVEKAGSPEKIKSLFEALERFGILEFSRSGKVAVSKPMRTLSYYLNRLEEQSKLNTKKENKHGKN